MATIKPARAGKSVVSIITLTKNEVKQIKSFRRKAGISSTDLNAIALIFFKLAFCRVDDAAAEWGEYQRYFRAEWGCDVQRQDMVMGSFDAYASRRASKASASR